MDILATSVYGQLYYATVLTEEEIQDLSPEELELRIYFFANVDTEI